MTDLLEGITSIAAAVPEQAKRNLLQAFGRLLGAAVEVPAAYLEGKAQGLRDDAAARSLVSKAAAEAAALRMREDPALAGRAVDYYAERMLRGQRNREAVAAITVGELTANPPTEAGTAPISDDWLDMFARLAEGRSDADVQAYFGKLLADEIRKPGSFSRAAINVLATLDAETGRLFQACCDVTVTLAALEVPMVITTPFGKAAQNHLAEFGLTYDGFARLQSAGLVHTELNSNWTIPRLLMNSGAEIAGKVVVSPAQFAGPFEWMRGEVKLEFVMFTTPGRELRRIVHATPNAAYTEKLLAWINQLMTPPSTEPPA